MHGCNHFKLSSTASHKLWTCFSQHWDWTIYRDFSITNSAIGNLTTSSFDHVSISRTCRGCCLCVHGCSCVHICYTHINTGVCGPLWVYTGARARHQMFFSITLFHNTLLPGQRVSPWPGSLTFQLDCPDSQLSRTAWILSPVLGYRHSWP